MPARKYSIEDCLEMLKALSDENRQQILMVIVQHKDMNVNDIAGKFQLSRPTISHHLSLMKRAKLLTSRKSGKEIYYSFNREYVIGLLETFTNNLKNCC